ncbi:MAG: hypothetical protein WCI00_01085 [bacterium]
MFTFTFLIIGFTVIPFKALKGTETILFTTVLTHAYLAYRNHVPIITYHVNV